MAGDAGGWWADRPFLTNVYSTVTGALFGIPIALFLIARLREGALADTGRARAHNALVALRHAIPSTPQRDEFVWAQVDMLWLHFRSLFEKSSRYTVTQVVATSKADVHLRMMRRITESGDTGSEDDRDRFQRSYRQLELILADLSDALVGARSDPQRA